jgi:hypothetical protein
LTANDFLTGEISLELSMIYQGVFRNVGLHFDMHKNFFIDISGFVVKADIKKLYHQEV